MANAVRSPAHGWERTIGLAAGRFEAQFRHHRAAALALLSECPELSHKTAGFLGNVCVAPTLSAKQKAWLTQLLEKHGLPELAVSDAPQRVG